MNIYYRQKKNFYQNDFSFKRKITEFKENWCSNLKNTDADILRNIPEKNKILFYQQIQW